MTELSSLTSDAPVIRRRSKLNRTAKGDVNPEVSLESIGLTRSEHMEELELLWVDTCELAAREATNV